LILGLLCSLVAELVLESVEKSWSGGGSGHLS